MDKPFNIFAERNEDAKISNRGDTALDGHPDFIFIERRLLFFIPDVFFAEDDLIIRFTEGDNGDFKFLADKRF